MSSLTVCSNLLFKTSSRIPKSPYLEITIICWNCPSLIPAFVIWCCLMQPLVQSCRRTRYHSPSNLVCTLTTKHLPISFSLWEGKHCFRELIAHVVSDKEEEIWREDNPLVKITKKVLMDSPVRWCCFLSGNQLVLQLPLHIHRLSIRLNKRERTVEKKAIWLLNIKQDFSFIALVLSWSENEDKI